MEDLSMRGLLTSCSIAAMVVLISVLAYSQDQGFSPTMAQQNFAVEVKSLPDVIQASWQSPLDLWVYADGVNQANAQTDLGQSLCVHVHNGDFNPLATKCWSSL